LLMSYFHLVARALNKNTFSFTTDELQTIGCKPVLTPQQVRANIKRLRDWGYVLIQKHHNIPRMIVVTILREDFPYV
jgi:hypothetical protein